MKYGIWSPGCDLVIDSVHVNQLVGLYEWLNMNLTLIDLGRSIGILVQKGYESIDDVNLVLNNEMPVYGTAYFVKMGVSKLMDLDDRDVDYIRTCVKSL